ncbi:Hypothetical protein SCV20265_1360 [Pseudomonas aeruginosa SCV20265]|nr:Hypothetical protein SCV20265_1360 [Pseudomonas aeruginosa SCV20265]
MTYHRHPRHRPLAVGFPRHPALVCLRIQTTLRYSPGGAVTNLQGIGPALGSPAGAGHALLPAGRRATDGGRRARTA